MVIRIPYITDDEMQFLLQCIKPIVSYKRVSGKHIRNIGGKPYFIKIKIDGEKKEKLSDVPFLDLPVDKMSEAHNVIVKDIIVTYHVYRDVYLFEPSIGDIFSQIKDRPDIKEIVGFEILEYISRKNLLTPPCNYHIALTGLYCYDPSIKY